MEPGWSTGPAGSPSARRANRRSETTRRRPPKPPNWRARRRSTTPSRERPATETDGPADGGRDGFHDVGDVGVGFRGGLGDFGFGFGAFADGFRNDRQADRRSAPARATSRRQSRDPAPQYGVGPRPGTEAALRERASTKGPPVEDLIVTTRGGYHVLRFVETSFDSSVFLHLWLDRDTGNLALARMRLRDLAEKLVLG